MKTATTSYRCVRLRVGTRARSIDGRGIAISAGTSAVIVDDAGAQALWTTIEPVLRAGVEPERLMATVPRRGRGVVDGILERLDAHQLLREVEPDAPEIAALAHLETVTRRPGAAARVVAATTVRVTGEGPVAHAVAAHLGALGYACVLMKTYTPEHVAPRASHVLARVERLGPDDAWHDVAFAVGDARTTVVGPRNRDADTGLEDAVLGRLSRFCVPDAPPDPEPLSAALVAAQLALAVLASCGRAVEDDDPPVWPEYLVTTDGVVSEPRPHVALPRLAHDGRVLGVDAWTTSEPHDEHGDPAALEGLSPVWDTALGLIGEPLPLDLPQLPAGLAALVDDEGRTLGGVGSTTAAARLDAAFAALRPVANGPAGHLAGMLGLGTSACAARADAVARLVERSDLGWRPVWREIESFGADVRSLHVALTRHLARPVSVALSASEVGLHRVDVRAPDGELLGRAVACSAGAAAHGALLRAVGFAQWQTSGACLVGRNPVIDVLETRASAVRTQLDRWARAAVGEGLRLVVPERAVDWHRLGVHAVVASWT